MAGQPQYTVEVELTAGVWTDVTTDVLGRVPVRAQRGIPNSGPTDQVARPGRMSFSLNNGAGNSASLAGYYSPGHVNKRAGFQHGTRVRLRILVPGVTDTFPLFGLPLHGDKLFGGARVSSDVSRYVFRGRLITIDPTPGVYGSAQTRCVAADWMQDLADFTETTLSLSESETSDQLLTSLVALLTNAPANTSFGVGVDTYDFAFDDIGKGTSAMTVAAKIMRSEGGFLYVRGDVTDGETLTMENRTARQAGSSLLTLTDGDMVAPGGVSVPSSLNRVFNDAEVRVYPRRVDTGNVVLVSLDSEIEVANGETLDPLWFAYKDPDSEAVFVGGKSIVTVDNSGTDATLNTTSGGGGTDETSEINSGTPGNDFSIDVTQFGSSVKIVFTNDTGGTRFVRGPANVDGMQLRGLGLYRYQPITFRGQNASSIAQFGTRALRSPIEMYYQSSRSVGQSYADLVVRNYSGLGNVPTRVQLRTENPTLLESVLPRDIGDRITVQEEQTAVNTDVIIHGVEYEIMNNVTKIAFTLAPADPTGAFILDDATDGLLDTGAFGYG